SQEVAAIQSDRGHGGLPFGSGRGVSRAIDRSIRHCSTAARRRTTGASGEAAPADSGGRWRCPAGGDRLSRRAAEARRRGEQSGGVGGPEEVGGNRDADAPSARPPPLGPLLRL